MGYILIISSYVFTKLIIPYINSLLTKAGAVRNNYLNKKIPIGLGLALLFGTIPSFLGYSILKKDQSIYLILLILTITLLVGFIDDLLGNHQVKGLRGHFKKLLVDGELTSGALKAIIISIISLFITLNFRINLAIIILNLMILILTTNAFNLLDVRPGRTIKVYIIACGLLLAFFPDNSIYLGFILASVLAYSPQDFKGKGMLGDSGSNFLGMSIAINIFFNISITTKIVIAVFLIGLHIYTEKKSLTVLIEKTTILRLIDNLGR